MLIDAPTRSHLLIGTGMKYFGGVIECDIFSLAIWSHLYVGTFFVNMGTNITSFEMVRGKKQHLAKI